MSTELDIQTVLTKAKDVALDLSNAAVAAFESRCALTKSECEGLHFSACRSRLPDGECTSNALTPTECLGASCGSVQDFSNPVGASVLARRFSHPPASTWARHYWRSRSSFFGQPKDLLFFGKPCDRSGHRAQPLATVVNQRIVGDSTLNTC